MDSKIEYVFRYFELHASQRMSTFNFFVVLSGLLISALVKTFENDFNYPQIGYGISLALIIVSLIFWKLDQRVRFLIKHSESELRKLEEDEKYPSLFKDEEIKTNSKEAGKYKGFFRFHLKYSECFGKIYLLFSVFGVVGIILKYLKLNMLI